MHLADQGCFTIIPLLFSGVAGWQADGLAGNDNKLPSHVLDKKNEFSSSSDNLFLYRGTSRWTTERETVVELDRVSFYKACMVFQSRREWEQKRLNHDGRASP